MFDHYFNPQRSDYLNRLIDLALDEDGRDLTSDALFSPQTELDASIIAKQETLVAGLPLIGRVLARMDRLFTCRIELVHHDGEMVANGTTVARFTGPAPTLLKAERVIMNFICRLSGIANATRAFVREVEGTGVKVLDTRKTMPGHRFLDKYAVLVGGGHNHRVNLEEMLMLKDNHIDQAGSITAAVTILRRTYQPCPPLEIECRTLADVHEAVPLKPERIMLDNMTRDVAVAALAAIPDSIETEISGNVSLATIRAWAELKPDFISTGSITHSAVAADFSMRLTATVAEKKNG
jgi:nicotinate-nucleotide pyrophosphorylase (carboxylating)